MRAEICATRPTTASTVMSMSTHPLACASGKRAARMLLSRLVPNVGRPIASLIPLGARSASTASAATSCATSTPLSVRRPATASRASSGRSRAGRADPAWPCLQASAARSASACRPPSEREACAAGIRAAAGSGALRRTGDRAARRRRRFRSPSARADRPPSRARWPGSTRCPGRRPRCPSAAGRRLGSGARTGRWPTRSAARRRARPRRRKPTVPPRPRACRRSSAGSPSAASGNAWAHPAPASSRENPPSRRRRPRRRPCRHAASCSSGDHGQ